MSANSSIQWTDHTFNPWWGCTKVSPGCDNCYAETLARRFGTRWGPEAPRRTFGADHWAEPLKWNAKAEAAGVRARVFCASMGDLGDVDAPAGEIERLWALIRVTPWLDWQLLTKRPAQLAKLLPEDWGEGYPNVWLGVSVELAEYYWRPAKLLAIPAAVHFLSCEPLLGPLDLAPWLTKVPTRGPGWQLSAGTALEIADVTLDWVIAGGESGPGARPCDLAWLRSLRDQCRAADVAFFCKQLGRRPVTTLEDWYMSPVSGRDASALGTKDVDFPFAEAAVAAGGSMYSAVVLPLKDSHGGDWEEWPKDLRIREFPVVGSVS
ncbi:MAG: DUF5131 family protein [Pseudomonadales bacterium]